MVKKIAAPTSASTADSTEDNLVLKIGHAEADVKILPLVKEEALGAAGFVYETAKLGAQVFLGAGVAALAGFTAYRLANTGSKKIADRLLPAAPEPIKS